MQSDYGVSKAGDSRREEILATAAELFASSGFRTSLQEIAEACGILPGSLYHHFVSKEAIIIELVQRYLADLRAIAHDAEENLEKGKSKPLFEQVLSLAEAITVCAIRHRAALLQTFYDPPPGASEALMNSAEEASKAINEAMLLILEGGRAHGELRAGVDLRLLAERICQSMLNSGVGVFHRTKNARHVPAVKCRMLLYGLATEAPKDSDLNASPAFAAARKVIASWAQKEGDDPAAQLRAAACAEFGRRGYDATTMRNIAVAAGMSTGAVYRIARSKDELLLSIMGAYIKRINSSWDAVLASPSTPVEKLDTLLWVDINLIDRFSAEFKIQLAWLRQSPPTTANIGEMEPRLQGLQELLDEGERTGQFRVAGASAMVRVRCLLELTWTPEILVRKIGVDAALSLARNSLIRGAVTRERP